MSALPTALEDAWNSALPDLRQVTASLASGGNGRPRIIRVGQLDSELLDQELAHLLQEPINKALALISFSIWNNGASYGAKLQDLRYVVPNSAGKLLTPSGLPRDTLLVHGTLTIILPYIHNRVRTHALSQAWPDAPSLDHRRKAWELLNSIESLYGLLGLVNFVAFLWSGKYRTLADRLLTMSLTPSRRLVRRDVSYEFMNRQMVWHAFTEFLLFLLPLINARMVRRRIYRVTAFLSPSSLSSLLPFRGLLGLPSEKAAAKAPQKRGKYYSLSENQCAICIENAMFNLNVSEQSNVFAVLAENSNTSTAGGPSDLDPPAHPICNPYQASCGHIYCYHCVAERIMRAADDAEDDLGWECLRCGEEVKEAHRYTVDITESEVSESDYEFSSDLDLGTDLSGSMGSYSESGFSE
ncbi:hypothetical protein NLJ89_g156 [Agrocybe chaxingu]|uniref:RING-type E3 ubiquitin transferase (cysteine targeting) n=1 Tax=Agrocybe chaxingu TaxID=84603 RepID=A0A9W8N2E3_9AGAR|nr:hypothetical protein NLJ89_g156 [Agrocybe chaxingu]